MSKLRVGYVRISSSDPPLSVTARLAEDRPDVTSGYGGWDEVTRPRRPPITTYRAPTALHLTLPLLLDRHADGHSIEGEISQLARMGRAPHASDTTPRLRIEAPGSAVPYQERTWVVDSITWGDAIMNEDGDRTRQQATVALIEYVEDLHLTEKSAATRQRTKANLTPLQRRAAEKRILAKRNSRAHGHGGTLRSIERAAQPFGDGEDLLTIAARELGDADRWVEIAKLNGLRDPRAITTGQVIRLP